ncbi:MAG: hypothetical protein ACKVXR_09875 [Planctomycetota bacterium]
MVLGTLAAPAFAIPALRSSAERGVAIAAAILSALEVLFLAFVCLVQILDG